LGTLRAASKPHADSALEQTGQPAQEENSATIIYFDLFNLQRHS
jgi:hypothetical protein